MNRKLSKTREGLRILRNARIHLANSVATVNGITSEAFVILDAYQILDEAHARLAKQNQANLRRLARHHAMLDLGLRGFKINGIMHYE
jgi:hypothetical protein